MLGMLQLLVKLSGLEAYARAVIVRVVTTLLLALLAATFAAIALGFAVSAGYAYLAVQMPPPVAAGLCAGVALILAMFIVVVVAFRLRQPSGRRPDPAQADLLSALAPLLAWARAHPLEAAAMALLVGLAGGRRRS